MKMIFSNARIVTRSTIIDGALVVSGETIEDLGHPESTGAAQVIDCDGDLLLPGLIEMHTDNLEMNIQPRPGVIWPSMMSAALAHDSQVAGAGITTVYDAVALGGLRSNSFREMILEDSLQAIKKGRELGLFRAEHLVHLRCEIGDEHLEKMLETYGDHDCVGLISIMDHTPGQRQWSNIADWRRYHREKKWTDEEASTIINELLERQSRHAVRHRELVVQYARQRAIPLASHDDTTVADCEQAAGEGVAIAEFPTTHTAACAARKNNLAIIMGAPNAVRGISHSGNISTRELASQDLLDGLSSDYVPASLLQAVFVLSDILELPLPKTAAMVSANIADMLGLADRGELAPGKRADLVRVTPYEGTPVVRQVWRQGKRVV